MNKLIFVAIAALLASFMVVPVSFVNAQETTIQQPQQQQTQTTITTTTTQHQWNPNHWLWRHGEHNPFGLFQSNNVVVVPAVTVEQAVVNTCPHVGDAPNATVLLSTGQCITPALALYEIQTGQIQIGGTVQAQGQIVVGTPVILGAHGYADPIEFLHHFRGHHVETTTTTTTTPAITP